MSNLLSYQGNKPKYCPFTIPANCDANLLTFLINKVWFYSSPYLDEVGYKFEGYKMHSMLEMTTFLIFNAKKYLNESNVYFIEDIGEAYVNHLELNADDDLQCEIECNFLSYKNYISDRQTFYDSIINDLYNGNFLSYKQLYAMLFGFPLMRSSDLIYRMADAEKKGEYDYTEKNHSNFLTTLSGRINQLLTNIYYFLNEV